MRSGSSNAGSAYTSPSMVSGASASVVSERTLSRLTKLESALDEERQARVRAEQELEEIKNVCTKIYFVLLLGLTFALRALVFENQ